jgi:uncharacterized glyoxalase superfamily protein PhnB
VLLIIRSALTRQSDESRGAVFVLPLRNDLTIGVVVLSKSHRAPVHRHSCISDPDVGAAADWLGNAFGFTIRLRIANHRIQLKAGDGCIILAEGTVPLETAHLVMVRVSDANSHYEQASKHGASILASPADHPYGERQNNAQDFAGHRWTFTQSIADVAHRAWGGTSISISLA